MRDAVLVQAGSNQHRPLLEFAFPRHAEYCARWGFDYRAEYEPQQTERHPVWDKIVLLRAALEAGYPYVVWLDADALIVDPTTDLRLALRWDLGMCDHPGPPYHLNAGAIYLRNEPWVRELFQRVWELHREHPWQEQQVLNELLEARRWAGVEVLHARWNSTVGVNEVAAAVVRAWHGPQDPQERLQAMQAL